MATISELKAAVLRLLDEQETTISDELMFDAISAALDEILPWVPKLSTVTLSKGNSSISLPVDFYAAEAVLDADGDTVPRARLIPGSYFGSKSDPNGWLLFPSKSITFAKALSEDHVLYYLAQWTKPNAQSSDSEEIEAPDFAFYAISLYAAAYCILPDAVSITEITQFKSRAESGNPEHNPRERSFEFLVKLFKDTVNRLPKYQRVGE